MKNEATRVTKRLKRQERQQTELKKRQQDRAQHPVAHQALAMVEIAFPFLAGLFFVTVLAALIIQELNWHYPPTDKEMFVVTALTVGAIFTTSIVQWCWHTICDCFGYHFYYHCAHLYSLVVGAVVAALSLVMCAVSENGGVVCALILPIAAGLYLSACAAIMFWNLSLPYLQLYQEGCKHS